ncbi:methyltransferase domain-containing protein [Nocardiopsis sp. NPDC007018]|uniref:class I SAM-dependent methyltransferase n=1 Tax=Nocardiopsis sp. NPDC007018 TaxID=3155721 RepID=UPI0033CD8670
MTAPRIHRHEWERQYESGRWDYLEDQDEIDRYALISQDVRSYRAGSVLDLGCGSGVLYRTLIADGFRGTYLGVDWSLGSLPRCAEHSIHRFVCGDLNRLPVRGTFDAIVLSEVLYYLEDPARTIRELTTMISSEGVLLASIYQPRAGRSSPWLDTVHELDVLLREAGAERREVFSVSRRGRIWAHYALSPKKNLSGSLIPSATGGEQ